MEAGGGNLPAVSIIIPTYRTLPESRMNAIRAKDAVHKTSKRLVRELGEDKAVLLTAKLEGLHRQIDFEHPQDGIGMYIGEKAEMLVSFPFPVQEKIVVGESFEIRDLIFARNRTMSYWVLALSMKPTRLFQGHGEMLKEIKNDQWPVVYEEQFEFPARQKPGISEYSEEESRIQDERLKAFFRHVDHLLEPLLQKDRKALVLLGVERHQAMFSEISDYSKWVEGRITGNFDHVSAGELAQKVWPVVKSAIGSEREKLLSKVVEQLGSGAAVFGLPSVWQAAKEGRGDLLLVEKDFTHQGFLLEDELTLLLEPDGESRMKVLQDAADEAMKVVLNFGGQVFFVENGELANYGSIALTTRF
jgi:hypothetical protein